MKVATPAISWHNREKITAVDFQPADWPPLPRTADPDVKRSRLATSGDDHHVVIWELKSKNGEPELPKFLCDLSRHLKPVNIVRWSKDGKYLASADADNAIFVWHFNENAAAPDIFGGDDDGEAKNVENWSVYKNLRGHLADVLDLCFSPCGNFLVSSSTDNSAIVFDIHKSSKVKMIGEHNGWVNGVTWDPLGKFLITMASDRCLRIFKTSKGYKSAGKVTKAKLSVGRDSETGAKNPEKNVRLFHDDTLKSFYRRLGFSPDGQLLAVPSGVIDIEGETSASHCTYIFSRTNFNKPVLFLPNKEFSTAVRFSQVKYKLRDIPRKSKGSEDEEKDEKTNKKPWEKVQTLFALPYRLVYAVATQNTVMFYDTQQYEPFARVSKIHYIGLTDLSWSRDGDTCIVSSTDGFCSLISFEPGELGEIYVEEGEKSSQENVEKSEKVGENVEKSSQENVEKSEKSPLENGEKSAREHGVESSEKDQENIDSNREEETLKSMVTEKPVGLLNSEPMEVEEMKA